MNRIPLPTDNIYKFYALFGLLLIIFSIGSTVLLSKSTNEKVYKYVVELEQSYRGVESQDQETDRQKVLKKLIDIEAKDRKELTRWLDVLSVVGTAVMVLGFVAWQTKIQPIEDELRSLQRDKLKLEVEKMRAETTPPTPAKPAEQDQSAPAGSAP